MGRLYKENYNAKRIIFLERRLRMAIRYYRPQALDTIARMCVCESSESYTCTVSKQAVPIEKIIENQYGLTIEYLYLTNDGRELGRMICADGYTTYFNRDAKEYAIMHVNSGTILIDASLLEQNVNEGRLRFTLAHELAHWLIHKKLYEDTCYSNFLDETDINENAIEWQANYLATAILMPSGKIKNSFHALRPVCNDQTDLISKMANIFEVSKQAMELRLKSMSLI